MARRRDTGPRQTLQVGDVAPDFELDASNGRRYRLSDIRLRQLVVLVWFPKAFTGGCTLQCTSIGAHTTRLRAHGAAVFGANADTVETNRQFVEALALDFPILSDPTHDTARAYGVDSGAGLPRRRTFYIGRDGRILSIDSGVRVSTNGADIERTLTQLQHDRTDAG